MMKKIKLWSMVMLVMMALPLVCSCSKDDDGGNGGVENRDDDEWEDESTIVSLTALDYTTDGYFDGVLYYQITSNTENTAEITKGSSNASAIKIPNHVKINGTTYSITSIRSRAFQNCTNLSSLVISNSVESIGECAFYFCSNLASVVFGKKVVSIGDGAFSTCPISRAEFSNMESLCRIMCLQTLSYHKNNSDWWNESFNKVLYIKGKEVHDIEIPDGITFIKSCAFDGCQGLTSVTIGNSVTSIGWRAFSGCSNLTSVVIGNSVTSIDSNTFSGCSNLTSVVIGNSVTSIDQSAFSGCIDLTSIKVESGNIVYDSRDNCNAIIETATNKLLKGCKNTRIPNSVTSIGYGAFSDCIGFTSIIIPNSVTSIGNSAFDGCI